MKIVYKIIRRLLDIFIIMACLFIVCIYLLQYVGIDAYIVQSGSMEPMIPTGSLCLVDTQYNYEDVVLNDIIAFESGDILVTHRVKQITPNGMITKGDNNEQSDGLTTSKENYVGKNIWTVPYLGYILSWIQSKRGKIIMITIFLIVILLHFLISEIKIQNRLDK